MSLWNFCPSSSLLSSRAAGTIFLSSNHSHNVKQGLIITWGRCKYALNINTIKFTKQRASDEGRKLLQISIHICPEQLVASHRLLCHSMDFLGLLAWVGGSNDSQNENTWWQPCIPCIPMMKCRLMFYSLRGEEHPVKF